MAVNRSRTNQNMMPNNGMNGNMNGRVLGGQGMDGNGAPLTGDLGDQIRALTFVLKELELYLDTHPDCRIALDYYYRTVTELKRLTEQYENTVGPLKSCGVVDAERWTWVATPWPWQREGDYMQPREER